MTRIVGSAKTQIEALIEEYDFSFSHTIDGFDEHYYREDFQLIFYPKDEELVLYKTWNGLCWKTEGYLESLMGYYCNFNNIADLLEKYLPSEEE